MFPAAAAQHGSVGLVAESNPPVAVVPRARDDGVLALGTIAPEELCGQTGVVRPADGDHDTFSAHQNG